MKKSLILTDDEFDNFVDRIGDDYSDYTFNRVIICNGYRIINGIRYNGFSANAVIECSRRSTAISRFVKELEKSGYYVSTDNFECGFNDMLNSGTAVEVEEYDQGTWYINYMCYQDETTDIETTETETTETLESSETETTETTKRFQNLNGRGAGRKRQDNVTPHLYFDDSPRTEWAMIEKCSQSSVIITSYYNMDVIKCERVGIRSPDFYFTMWSVIRQMQNNIFFDGVTMRQEERMRYLLKTIDSFTVEAVIEQVHRMNPGERFDTFTIKNFVEFFRKKA